MTKYAPKTKPCDWLRVGENDCVVMSVYENGSCKVVFNKEKPTTEIAEWNGEQWTFNNTADFGGYAKEHDRFVQQLKRGK